MSSVYLIHFDRPYGHARHYIGFAENLEGRIKHHRNGTGANLMRVVNNAGIGWEVARVWDGESRTFERKLKNRHKSSQLCPICRNPVARLVLENSRPRGGDLNS